MLSSGPRRAALLVAAGGACAVAAAVGTAACLTAPPPDLPELPAHAPTILHDALQPPEGEILTQWPSEFLVPVRLDPTDPTFQYDAFIDYDPVAQTQPVSGPSPSLQPALDGGVYVLPVSLPEHTPVPGVCPDRVEILVGHGFSAAHTFDSIGGDIATWFYVPPGGCPLFEAGAFGDGGFGPLDASSDGPFLPADGGSE